MEGYYKDAAATQAAVDSRGWLHSGDLGSFDNDGYLTFRGRKKEMLKVGGENVSIAEVEAVIAQHPGVAFVAVVGAPHPRLGEVGVAFVITRHDVAPDALTTYSAERLAPYKVPARFVVIDQHELEYTGSQKLIRRPLAERARDLMKDVAL
jgi:acyl-CoA synthetase (AMP-forming)/AMP-acid ligase II